MSDLRPVSQEALEVIQDHLANIVPFAHEDWLERHARTIATTLDEDGLLAPEPPSLPDPFDDPLPSMPFYRYLQINRDRFLGDS